MKIRYIINNKVCYLPEEHRLEPIEDQGAAITLNIPASKCFLLLLQRAGEVIRQDEFIREVWENRGQYASTNTYFQNIHILRKSLKIAGIDSDIIKTIPKEGVLFTGSIEIINEEEIDISPTQLIINEEQYGVPHKKIKSKWLKYVMVFVLLLFITFFILLWMNLQYPISDNDAFFSKYNKIGEANHCQVYASQDSVLRQNQEYLSFIQEKNIICSPGQKAYMAINISGTRVFVHICNKNDNGSCITNLYMIEKRHGN